MWLELVCSHVLLGHQLESRILQYALAPKVQGEGICGENTDRLDVIKVADWDAAHLVDIITRW